MKNKYGFTLVELLAVIIILAIIGLIAVFVVRGIRENYEKSIFTTSAKNILRSAMDYHAKEDYKNFPEEGIDINDGVLELQISEEYISGKVFYDYENNKYLLSNLTNGTWCASGLLDDLEVIKGDECIIN